MTKYYSRTPTDEVVKQAACFPRDRLGEPLGIAEAGYDRWKAQVEAAAEQRGEVKAFRKTQEIIAGFDHTIDEERERGDMINTGYLIQEIDTEIQDLMEADDA